MNIFIYDFKNHMWCSENFRKVRREINYWCKDNNFFTLYYLICINLNSRYFVMWCEVYIPVLYIFILIVRWISQKSYHWVDTRRGGRGQVATRKQFLIGYADRTNYCCIRVCLCKIWEDKGHCIRVSEASFGITVS